jgi:hypothetical protein
LRLGVGVARRNPFGEKQSCEEQREAFHQVHPEDEICNNNGGRECYNTTTPRCMFAGCILSAESGKLAQTFLDVGTRFPSKGCAVSRATERLPTTRAVDFAVWQIAVSRLRNNHQAQTIAMNPRPITVRPQREQPNLLFWPSFSYRKLMSEGTEAAIGALACPTMKGRCAAVLGASCMLGAQSLPLRESSKATRRSYPAVALVQTQ